jgi:hypothetical protein
MRNIEYQLLVGGEVACSQDVSKSVGDTTLAKRLGVIWPASRG